MDRTGHPCVAELRTVLRSQVPEPHSRLRRFVLSARGKFMESVPDLLRERRRYHHMCLKKGPWSLAARIRLVAATPASCATSA